MADLKDTCGMYEQIRNLVVTLEDIEATQRAWLMYKRLYPPKEPPVHHEWNWKEKAVSEIDCSVVSLKYAGETHGMMMGALVPQPFRLPGSMHKTLL